MNDTTQNRPGGVMVGAQATGVDDQWAFLSRYARVLTGSALAGTSCVTAVFGTQPLRFLLQPGLPARAPFRALSRYYNDMREVCADGDHPFGSTFDTSRARQALLLVWLEGFGEEDAAYILDVSLPLLRRLLDRAQAAIARERPRTVLIVDDSTHSSNGSDLKEMLTRLGHEVLGPVTTRREARTLAQERRPDLVLMRPLHLADGSIGLTVADELAQICAPGLVFFTRHPREYLSWNQSSPVFLVCPPYRPEGLSAVTSQAVFFARNADPGSPG